MSINWDQQLRMCFFFLQVLVDLLGFQVRLKTKLFKYNILTPTQ